MYKYLIKEDDDKLVIVGEGTKITVDKKKYGLVSVKTEAITENEYLLSRIEELEKRVAELEGSVQIQPCNKNYCSFSQDAFVRKSN